MAMLKRAVVLVALCSALASCTFRRPPPHHPVTPPEDPVIGGDVNLPPGDPPEACGSNRPRDCLRVGQDLPSAGTARRAQPGSS